ncbi:hypothetical protein D9M69_514560 [compost metagenome]
MQVQSLSPYHRLGDQDTRVAIRPVERQLDQAPGSDLGTAIHQAGKTSLQAAVLLTQTGPELFPQVLGLVRVQQTLVPFVALTTLAEGFDEFLERRSQIAGRLIVRRQLVKSPGYRYQGGVAVTVMALDRSAQFLEELSGPPFQPAVVKQLQ